MVTLYDKDGNTLATPYMVDAREICEHGQWSLSPPETAKAGMPDLDSRVDAAGDATPADSTAKRPYNRKAKRPYNRKAKS